MRARTPLALFLAALLAASLAACGQTKDVRAQLDELVAAKGTTLVGVRVAKVGKGLDRTVSIGVLEEANTSWYSVFNGNIVTDLSASIPLAGGPMTVDAFDLEALEEKVDAIASDPQCAYASATAVVVPVGVGIFATCQGVDGTPSSRASLSEINGESACFEAGDFREPAVLEAAAEVYRRATGTTDIVGFTYATTAGTASIEGTDLLSIDGSTCPASLRISEREPSPPAPVGCGIGIDGSPFDFAAAAPGIAETILKVRSSALDQSLITLIEFTGTPEGIAWKVATSLEETLAHPDLVKGMIGRS